MSLFKMNTDGGKVVGVDAPSVRGPPSLGLRARTWMLLRLMALCGDSPTHIASTALGRSV